MQQDLPGFENLAGQSIKTASGLKLFDEIVSGFKMKKLASIMANNFLFVPIPYLLNLIREWDVASGWLLKKIGGVNE